MNGPMLKRLHNSDYPLRVEIPERHGQHRLADIPNKGLGKLVLEYVDRFWELAPQGRAPVFLGVARSWKSTAASILARWVGRQGLSTDFVDCGRVIPRMERERYEEWVSVAIRQWCNAPFLVMDDFTAVSEKGFMVNVLHEVVASRFNDMLPTVWTGNVACDGESDDVWEALTTTYGVVFTRRLEDTGEGFTMILK